jgi:DNA-directed RNA polymerase subunit L
MSAASIKSAPKITNLSESDDAIRFTLSNVDVSIANGLRRTLLSDIRSVVFRGFPYEESRINISTNTSRLNNEIIKQRISCVPIHITDPDFPIADHIVEMSIQNTTDHTIYATTGDFKIKNTNTDSYLTNDAVREIFPASPISGEFIDLVRLRPNTMGHNKGEEIVLRAELDWGTQAEDGAFNAVSVCIYSNTLDQVDANKRWTEREKELKHESATAEMIQMAKSDWTNLDAYRSFKPNSYDFDIESVGVWDNSRVVLMGCDAMIRRIRDFANEVETNRGELIGVSDTTIRNSYDITMKNQDYTLGKVLEYFLYNDYYMMNGGKSPQILTFCGFAKPHPHINESVIRIALADQPADATGTIVSMIVEVSNRAIDIYSKIRPYFDNTSGGKRKMS